MTLHICSIYSDHRQAGLATGTSSVSPSNDTDSATMSDVSTAAAGGARPKESVANDDAAFRQKLKHMGKSKQKLLVTFYYTLSKKL